MGFENIEIHRFDERIGLGITEEEELEDLNLPTEKRDNILDGPEVQKNLRRLINWWYRESFPNRFNWDSRGCLQPCHRQL